MKETIQHIRQTIQENRATEEDWKRWFEDPRKGVVQLCKKEGRRRERERAIKEAWREKVTFEASFKTDDTSYVIGIDEAGRGPLAGPVVTAAVKLPFHYEAFVGMDDSKSLTKEARRTFAEHIRSSGVEYAVHIQPRSVIDEVNIYEATRQSMERALDEMDIDRSIILTDAMPLRRYEATAVTKGDAKSLAIAAASILAKTVRDAYMDELDERYPEYGFAHHAGYGTKEHIRAIEQFGVIDEHRTTFEPIRSLLKGD